MAIRLRISSYTVPFHGRDFVYCYDGKERYLDDCSIDASSWKANLHTAKHLEPLKGGKVPLEILVRGKDAAANEKLFTKITDVIQSSGVSSQQYHFSQKSQTNKCYFPEENRSSTKRCI